MIEQDKRVRDYYAKLTMPSEKLDQLISMRAADFSDGRNSSSGHGVAEADQRSPGTNYASFFRRLFHVLKMSAWHPGLKAVTAAVMVMMVSLWMHNSGTESERMLRTVKEVAMNHTTRLEPEYRGDSLSSLDNSMQQLSFALALPKTVLSTYELVGSRYCSLGGALAAHVKFKQKSSGRPMSLFVTADSKELEELRAQQTSHEGVSVEFWKEGGLFYAMAERT